jgi:hypothetical protein
MRLDLVNLRAIAANGAGPSLLSEWRVGAILEAIAVRDATTGQLSLDIGQQRHPARVASGEREGPQHGEKLQVRVLRLSPVLALETVASAQPTDDLDAAADALRRYVPRQESPALLLANIAWLAQGKGDAAALPKAVTQALARLWAALPTPQTLSAPDALETAVLRSGAFLEHQLAANPSGERHAYAADLKALLLSLGKSLRAAGAQPEAARTDHTNAPTPLARGPLAALPPAPATFAVLDTGEQQLNELSRQTEGALARLTTAQIANSTPDSASHTLLVELPVRHEDRTSMLRLRFEREGSRGQGAAMEGWSVEAALDLGVAGALHARVTLSGRRIGVQLRAETPAIVDALSARAPQLAAILRDAGLDVDRIVCLHGLPAGDSGARSARLLDVRA